MSRLKIIVFIIALGILGSVVGTAWWFYSRVLGHDSRLHSEIQAMQGQKGGALPDPGVRRFEKAIEDVRANNIDGGRTALYELVRTFPSSTRVGEAKRIIGEMNMDTLLNPEINPLKKDYIVQPGDSLLRIAGKNQTTVECLIRANGLQSSLLQPGDHLAVFPLDFEIVVHVSAKTLTLLRNERFFKEYEALDVRLPPATRVPFETKVNEKAAWVGGRRVQSTSADFHGADKWISTEKSGFTIRSLPKARPVLPKAIPVAAPAKTTRKQKERGAVLAGTTVDDDEVDATAGVPETGAFLANEDVEELFTIIRTKTVVKVVR